MMVPNSWGSFREMNTCHAPEDGKFCSGEGSGRMEPVEGQRYYIRFGDLPKSGRSANFARGTIEAGVSVYDAVGRSGKFLVEVPPDGEWAHEDLTERIVRARRQQETAYVVTGERVGSGHDGEPLLGSVTVLGEVDPDRLRGADL